MRVRMIAWAYENGEEVSMARLKIGHVVEFGSAEEWEEWLSANHDSKSEAWLRLAKKGSGAVTITRAQALETALTYGWIDGQAASQDDTYWLQRFTPRTRRSKWSRINREAAEHLIAAGKMKPAGLAVVEAAKSNGRWEAAYPPPSSIEVPEDFAERLRRSRAAYAFFERLSARNRHAILYRVADAKKQETRARRIEKYVDMLEHGETTY